MRSNTPVRKRKARTTKNEWLRVVGSLESLMERRAEAAGLEREKLVLPKATIDALNRAYSATSRYYTFLLSGGPHDSRVQKLISKLWQHAGIQLRKFDPDLARRLKSTNGFWSNDATWQQETVQQAWTHLNSIRVSTNRLDPNLRGPFSHS